MARLYFLSSTNSDLTGGADFSRALFYNNNAASTTLSISIAQAATEVSRGFTPLLHPSVYGATGNYTVVVDVTTSNSNIFCTITLRRIDSTGTIGTSSATSAEQQFNTTGAKTFSFTSLNLGTWASGDRLRVDYSFRNSAAHQASSFAIGINDPDTRVETPFNVRSFVTT